MFVLKSKEQIAKAIETARRHTSVKFVGFGDYKVRGRQLLHREVREAQQMEGC